MNAKDLLYQSQKEFVSSEYGLGESIVYTHNDGTTETVNAFVDASSYHNQEKLETHNASVFYNVILKKKPTIVDTITFNGLIWKVRDWELQGNLYIIYADNEKRNRTETRRVRK